MLSPHVKHDLNRDMCCLTQMLVVTVTLTSLAPERRSHPTNTRSKQQNTCQLNSYHATGITSVFYPGCAKILFCYEDLIQLNLAKKIRKSIIWVWILALGKLHPGEYNSLSRTCLVCWKSLKTNTSGFIIAGTFHHEGAVSWNHTVKRVRKSMEFFFSSTLLKIPSAEARLLAWRLDLCCTPLVLWALSILEA